LRVEAMTASTRGSYQHELAGNASRADRTAADLDLDSPLVRLAAGGRRG